MNIPYYGINKLLDDNREMSAGEMPIAREEYAIHMTYVDGVQTMGVSRDDDFFWPEDGDTVHFLDASGRHVFVQRRGKQLILMLEITMPEDREFDAEFMKQTTELHMPDTFDLVPVDLESFIEFMEYDTKINTEPLHRAVVTSIVQNAHTAEGDTPMSNASKKVEEVGAKIQGAVGTATVKTAAVVENAGVKMDEVRSSVQGRVEDIQDSAANLRDTVADATHVVGERASDLGRDIKDAGAAAFEVIDPRSWWERHDMTKRAAIFLGGVGLGILIGRP